MVKFYVTESGQQQSFLIQQDYQPNQHHIEILSLAGAIEEKMKCTGALGTTFELTDINGLEQLINRLIKYPGTARTVVGTCYAVQDELPASKLLLQLTQQFRNNDPQNDPEHLLLCDESLLTDAKFMFDWTVRGEMLITDDGYQITTLIENRYS